MTRRQDDRGPGATLLFLALSIALAVVVQLFYVAPAEARLEDRRALRQELELRQQRSAARRDELFIADRALRDDPQTRERYLRRLGYGRADELRLAPEDGR
ncbi:MAG: hypothetical protein H6807_02435 [Planctomycetes bacterium]|nr:hypothetical protein [Planctomycetota bacterium]